MISFSSNLPNDVLQKLRKEIDHLKERFHESVNNVETRTSFIKKTLQVRPNIFSFA